MLRSAGASSRKIGAPSHYSNPTKMLEAVREHFDLEVDSFDGGYQDELRRYHLILRRNLILEEFAQLNPAPDGGPWLEAGCGAGLLACDIAARGQHVFGLDLSTGMIERAQANAERLGVSSQTTFQVGTLESLPLESGSVAGVVCSGVIEYFADPRSALIEFARVLRPGAPFIVTFNNAFSVFRWLSGPAKKLPLRIFGRPAPSFAHRAYTTGQAERLFAGAKMRVSHWRRHTFAAQAGSLWLPPLFVARRLEGLSDMPLLRELAWGLVAVGRRDS